MQLFTNGHIHTPHGNALAVLVDDNGIITEVYNDPNFSAPSSAVRIDLDGGFLFPGFTDAHNHPAMMGRFMIECDAKTAPSWDAASTQIREWITAHPANEWVVVHGWDQLAWGYLTTADLDLLCPDRPLFIIHIAYHGAVLNSAALRWLAEHDVTIAHENGVLNESAYQVVETVTLPSYEQFLEILLRYGNWLRTFGITTTHDMWITTVDELRAYQELDRAGKLPVSVEGYINPELLRRDDIAQYLQPTGSRFRVRGIKLFLDGAIGMRTAYVHADYTDAHHRGVLRYQPEQILEYIRMMEEAGLHSAAIHAIGDAAVSTVLDIYTQAAQLYDLTQYRIEHCEMIPPAEYGRLRELGVWLVMQPNFHWDIGHYGDRLGERVNLINPFSDLLREQIRFTFGSDNIPTGVLEGLEYATTVGEPHQRLNRADALAHYTNGGQIFGDATCSITVGCAADFVLLSGNILDEHTPISDIRVLRSYKNGRV